MNANMLRFLAVLMLPAALCGLSGCETISPYHAFNSTDGYFETPLTQGEYEVLYIGTRRQDSVEVAYYATLRCAELTMMRHCQYFEVTSCKAMTRTASADRAVSSEMPSCRLNFRILDRVTAKSIDARELLMDAHVRKTPLDPKTREVLGLAAD